MSLFNIISIFMVVLIGIALVVAELKSYRYKQQQLLDSKAKVLADIDAYEQKKEQSSPIGDQVAQEMFQRLKQKSWNEKLIKNHRQDGLD